MERIYLISAILMQISLCYGYPGPTGIGAYAYEDSQGHRYRGTYDLPDGVFLHNNPFAVPFNDVNTFFPNYFSTYENILQQIFGSDIENQRLASYAARKAYDLTYNRAGYNSDFFRFPHFGGFPFGPGPFPADMAQGSNFNSAFASSAAGPGFRHQVAAIDPININMPNVDVSDTLENKEGKAGKFYSVSSSSYASSSNVDGKTQGFRGAETVVNDNGKITKYKVHS